MDGRKDNEPGSAFGGGITTAPPQTKKSKCKRVLLFAHISLRWNIKVHQPGVIYPRHILSFWRAWEDSKDEEKENTNQSRHDGGTVIEACHSRTSLVQSSRGDK